MLDDENCSWNPSSVNGWHWGHSPWSRPFRLKKLLLLLSRLRAARSLTAKVFAGLLCHLLPAATARATRAAEDPWEFGETISTFAADKLGSILQDMKRLAEEMGLEGCAIGCIALLDSLLTGDAAAAGNSLLMLLTALHSLPFDRQVNFIQQLYTSQEQRIHVHLDEVDTVHKAVHGWWSNWSTAFEQDLSCVGCGVRPIKGLCFKCALCPDYQLCGECYAEKSAVHECKGELHQELDCLQWPSQISDESHEAQGAACFWKPRWAGKGGKGGKGWRSPAHFASWKPHWKEHGSQGKEQRKEGWKGRGWCEGKGKGKGKAPEAVDSEDPASPKHCGRPDCTNQDAIRLRYPVDVEDGRQLTIEWQMGQDVQQVAQNFAAAHNIPSEEIPTIVDFVNRANSENATAVPAAPTEEEAVARTAALHEAAMKLSEMGFGHVEELRAVLEGCGGDLNKTLESLTLP